MERSEQRTAQPPLPPPPTAGCECAMNVPALAERVRPFVVNITTTQRAREQEPGIIDPFEFFFGPRSGRPDRQVPRRIGLGSGFILDPAGYVVTNEHVIDGASSIVVRLADDREFDANVVGRDPKLDVALLRLEGAKQLPAATLGSSEALPVGAPVMAVGNPFGLGHTVTTGIVSAKARSIGVGPYDDFIQTDASINPGNSGGPLFDANGSVVGINTIIRAGATGIGFAIPVEELKEVLPQLREKGHVERGRIGLAFQPVTQDLAKALGLDRPQGALVAQIETGGPAARAGIRIGDVITKVDGVPIRQAEELARTIARHPPGTLVSVSIFRDGREHTVTAKLDALAGETAQTPGNNPPERGGAPSFGLQVSSAPGGGVRVDSVAPGANVGDLEPGDVVLEIDHRPVTDIDAFRAALAAARPGTTALVRVRRGEILHFVALPIPSR